MIHTEIEFEENKTILIFKTISPYFELERDWKKPFTMRRNDHGIRFMYLLNFKQDLDNLYIKSINPQTDETFTRKIGNVCFYDGYWLISFDLLEYKESGFWL